MLANIGGALPGPSRPSAPTESFVAMAIAGRRAPSSFRVSSYGDPRVSHVLFPENTIPLMQGAVDAAGYERIFRELHPEAQRALRRWAATDADVGHYRDGTPDLNTLGVEPMNFDLNARLVAGIASGSEEACVANHLSSALAVLIPMPGDFLRVAEYPDSAACPWGTAIRVGDVVTNYPCFMSASMDSDYAALTARGQVVSTATTVLAFFLIEHARTAIPLLQGIGSLTQEREVLFPRASAFVVKGIAVANAVADEFPATRVGILLEQVAVQAEMKNIHTGAPISIPANGDMDAACSSVGVNPAARGGGGGSTIPEARTVEVTMEGRQGNVTCRVVTLGDARSEQMLFPEHGVPLHQEAANERRDREAFLALSPAARFALRRWAMTDTDRGHYFDGTPDFLTQGFRPIESELNASLGAGTMLSPGDASTITNLTSALRSLPPMPGEFMSAIEYDDRSGYPWGLSIDIGDVVTPFPYFMRAERHSGFTAAIARRQLTMPHATAVAFLKFETTSTAVPLWSGVTSLQPSFCVVFPRDAAFVVKGIAVAQPVEPDIAAVRIGVLLEQLPPSQARTARHLKNIMLGRQVVFARRP